LKLYKDIYELSWEDFNKRLKYFDELLDIKKLLDKRVRKLSLGERMRCEVVASLLHKPDIVFLDEPTIGLDVVAKEEVRNFLREINKKEGTTVLLTTHDMADIEALCKHIIVLDKGRKIYDGELEKLKEKYIWKKYVRLFHSGITNKKLFQSTLKKCETTEKKDSFISLAFDSRKQRQATIIGNLMASCRVLDLNVSEPDLKEIIAQIYRRGKA
jgi:ABC-2 type transport system ATP-binding protein